MSEERTEPVQVAEFPYRRDNTDTYELYDTLKGPNGFECTLTEPEDRNWYRDGQVVVVELNRLAARASAAESKVVRLREALDSIRDSVLNQRHQLAEVPCDNDFINAVLGIIDDNSP